MASNFPRVIFTHELTEAQRKIGQTPFLSRIVQVDAVRMVIEVKLKDAMGVYQWLVCGEGYVYAITVTAAVLWGLKCTEGEDNGE